MTYQEALELKEKSEVLIGSLTEKGFAIDEIIIVPSDDKIQNRFFNSYLLSGFDPNVIEYYLDYSLEVWAIDKGNLEQNHVLFFKKLG